MIRTKCVYDPGSDEDGVRVLVTRYWPRGVKKEKADIWLRELGPQPGLIKKWKAGGIGFDEFKKAYAAEYSDEAKEKAFKELKAVIKGAKGRDVTILCTCHEEDECHRRMIKERLKSIKLF